MIRLTFSEADVKALDHERYHHPHPRVQRKMEALWLKSCGLPHKEICRLTGICSTTLTRYLRAYQAGGLEALKTLTFYRPESELQHYRATLEDYFRAHPPATAKEARVAIEQLTGIQRSPDRVRHFLKGLGMNCRKVGMLPAKADAAAQEAFQKTP
jgi:transposase